MGMKRALAGIVGVLALSSSLPATPDVSAAGGAPLVRVTATARSSVVIRAADGTVNSATLGLWVEAPRETFEVRLRRPYGQAMTARLVDGTTGRSRPLDVPLGDFGGLEKFVTFDVATTDGVVIRRLTTDFCPDQDSASRTNVSGPESPTYPIGCVPSVWTAGFRYGIDKGWSVPAISTPDDADALFADLPDGTYRVSATLGRRWQRQLGIGDDAASATIKVTLKTSPSIETTVGRAEWIAGSGDDLFTTSSDEGRTEPDASDAAARRNPEVLPDLVAMPAWQVLTMTIGNRDLLAFAANVANVGNAPLVVEGYRAPGASLMTSYQFFYDGETPVDSERVGGMKYDPRVGHEHWHFKDFAAYDLVTGDKKHLARSGKEAFCLAPTDAIDLTLEHADLQPEATGLEGACGDIDSRWIRQVLPVGWGDTYMQFLPGQSFDITNLPNGTYYLKVTANPKGRLIETTRENNVSFRRIVLGGTKGLRTVRVPDWRGMDTEFALMNRGALTEALSRHQLTLRNTSAPAGRAEELTVRQRALLAVCRIPT